MHFLSNEKVLIVLYAAGPGNVLGTYRHWRTGVEDPNEVSLTYSGQFFDVVESMNGRAIVIASHSPPTKDSSGNFRIEHWVRSSQGKRGVWYHIHELKYCGKLIWKALVKRVSVVLLGDIQHWWIFSILGVFGIKVVPTLHCSLWPAGNRPKGYKDRIIQSLNGWFWRRVASASICVSPECMRQLNELTRNRTLGPIYVGLAQFNKGHFDRIPAPPATRRPFHIMFAGRIEESKGVFDLVRVVEYLRQKGINDIRLEICGTGTAEQHLRQTVEESKLTNEIKILGRLNRDEMLASYSRSHLVIVPTTSSFSEGLNKVVVEGILAHRPTICSSVCHAKDLLGDAIIEIPPGDIVGFADAIEKLYRSEEQYSDMVQECHLVGEKFYDRSYGWGNALAHALDDCLNP